MILTAEALRLAAVEVLRPTGAVDDFPTLAGAMVFDSRAAAVADLDKTPAGDLPYTPVLALYTRDEKATSRGDAAAIDDNACSCVLEIIGELAVIDEDEDGPFVDALSGSDPEARLVLAAMMAQVRNELLHAQRGHLFRRIALHCDAIDIEPHTVPELGLRFHRMFMRMTMRIRDDAFSDAGGLAGPVKTLFDALPSGSYAKAKLTVLSGYLAGQTLPALEGVEITQTGADDPLASVEFGE